MESPVRPGSSEPLLLLRAITANSAANKTTTLPTNSKRSPSHLWHFVQYICDKVWQIGVHVCFNKSVAAYWWEQLRTCFYNKHLMCHTNSKFPAILDNSSTGSLYSTLWDCTAHIVIELAMKDRLAPPLTTNCHSVALCLWQKLLNVLPWSIRLNKSWMDILTIHVTLTIVWQRYSPHFATWITC